MHHLWPTILTLFRIMGAVCKWAQSKCVLIEGCEIWPAHKCVRTGWEELSQRSGEGEGEQMELAEHNMCDNWEGSAYHCTAIKVNTWTFGLTEHTGWILPRTAIKRSLITCNHCITTFLKVLLIVTTLIHARARIIWCGLRQQITW